MAPWSPGSVQRESAWPPEVSSPFGSWCAASVSVGRLRTRMPLAMTGPMLYLVALRRSGRTSPDGNPTPIQDSHRSQYHVPAVVTVIW